MKLNLWKPNPGNHVFLALMDYTPLQGEVFVGTTDLDIQKPKKTVVKEALGMIKVEYAYDKIGVEWRLPKEANNIKCTYEINEE